MIGTDGAHTTGRFLPDSAKRPCRFANWLHLQSDGGLATMKGEKTPAELAQLHDVQADRGVEGKLPEGSSQRVRSQIHVTLPNAVILKATGFAKPTRERIVIARVPGKRPPHPLKETAKCVCWLPPRPCWEAWSLPPRPSLARTM